MTPLWFDEEGIMRWSLAHDVTMDFHFTPNDVQNPPVVARLCNMKFCRPNGLLAGFYAGIPDPLVPELLHVGEQWAPADFFITEHTHPVWEFYLQIGGESRWDGDGTPHSLGSGGFFATAPGVPHKMRDRQKTRHHFLFAAIDIERICRRQEGLHDFWKGRRIVFEPNAEALQAPFRQLIREISLRLPHQTVGIRTALDYLVIEATRLLASERNPVQVISSHPAVLRAREMLDYHPAEHWKLSELARVAGLSPSRLSECFSNDTGMSPHQYLLCKRIELAREALQQSDITVTDLALDLGFSSSQHFASTFKRMVGVPAQTFRKQALSPMGLQRAAGSV